MMRFGTTITFCMVLPERYFSVRSSARTAFSTTSFGVFTGKFIGKRTLPLKLTIIFTSSSLRYFSSYSGHLASHTLPLLPRACHSSSAICGANGAISTTRS